MFPSPRAMLSVPMDEPDTERNGWRGHRLGWLRRAHQYIMDHESPADSMALSRLAPLIRDIRLLTPFLGYLVPLHRRRTDAWNPLWEDTRHCILTNSYLANGLPRRCLCIPSEHFPRVWLGAFVWWLRHGRGRAPGGSMRHALQRVLPPVALEWGLNDTLWCPLMLGNDQYQLWRTRCVVVLLGLCKHESMGQGTPLARAWVMQRPSHHITPSLRLFMETDTM